MIIAKLDKIAFLLRIAGILTVIVAGFFRGLPLFIDTGPQGWFQYFIAMCGFLAVIAGFAMSWELESKDQSTRRFALLFILGGLYIFVMTGIIFSRLRWLFLFSSLGLICVMVGLVIYFYKANIMKSGFSVFANPYLIKIILAAWISIWLACFLIYWGAPIEFWAILDRFGINVEEGGILRMIQQFLIQFFTYSSNLSTKL